MLQIVKNRLRSALLWTQQYTGTNNLYIAKSGFWTSLPYVVGSILSATQIILFANLLPKETYGTYKYILSIAGSFGFLTLTGMNAAITQMTAQGIEGILQKSVRLQLRFNVLYAIAAGILTLYYGYHGNMTLSLGIAILGVTFPFSAALNSYGAYLTGKKDFRTGSLYGIISNVVSFILISGAIIFTRNAVLIILGYTLGTLLPVSIFYFRTIKNMPATSATSEQERALRHYASHLSFLNILSTLGSYLDKIILFQVTGAVELAVYSLAQAVPNRIEGFFKSFNSILLPKLSENTLDQIAPVFYKRLLQGMLTGLIVVVGYWIFAPIGFQLILPKYIDAVPYSRVLMLTFVFTLPGAYMANVFRSQKMLRVIYLSSTFGNLMILGSYAILTPLWGIWGLVWSQVFAQAAGIIFNCFLWQWALKRHHAVPSR